jgi:hypothetical protein
MTKLQQCAAFVLAATILAGGTGCIQTNITQTPVAWTPKPMAPGSYTVLNGGKPVSGKVVVDFLDKSNNDLNSSTMRQAVDQALAQCPGADALIDITQDHRITNKTLMIGMFPWPLESSMTYFITGVPVKTKDSSQVRPVRAQP